MRLYFMRANKIEGVTFLKSGPDDAVIKEARSIFQQRAEQHFDGFELWDGNRFVYRLRSDEARAPSGDKGG